MLEGLQTRLVKPLQAVNVVLDLPEDLAALAAVQVSLTTGKARVVDLMEAVLVAKVKEQLHVNLEIAPENFMLVEGLVMVRRTGRENMATLAI